MYRHSMKFTMTLFGISSKREKSRTFKIESKMSKIFWLFYFTHGRLNRKSDRGWKRAIIILPESSCSFKPLLFCSLPIEGLTINILLFNPSDLMKLGKISAKLRYFFWVENFSAAGWAQGVPKNPLPHSIILKGKKNSLFGRRSPNWEPDSGGLLPAGKDQGFQGSESWEEGASWAKRAASSLGT